MNTFSKHWFSWGLVAVWAIVYLIGLKTELSDLLANKGISVLGKEYYRFFTALFLHSNLLHMLLNSAALYFVGIYLEPQIAPWKLMVFSVSIAVVTEMLFSWLYQSADSVGGSPIVFALIGLIIAMQVTKSAQIPFKMGTWYGNWITTYAVLANIPLFSTSFLSTILIHGMPLVLGFLAGCLCMKIL